MMSARLSTVLFVSSNDPLHQRMADDVAFGEFDHSDAFGVSQNPMRFEGALIVIVPWSRCSAEHPLFAAGRSTGELHLCGVDVAFGDRGL